MIKLHFYENKVRFII